MKYDWLLLSMTFEQSHHVNKFQRFTPAYIVSASPFSGPDVINKLEHIKIYWKDENEEKDRPEANVKNKQRNYATPK